MSDRLSIGSNHPPEPLDPIPALQLDIDQLVEEADGLGVITTLEQAEQVKELLSRTKDSAKAIKTALDGETAPHLAAEKVVRARYKPLQTAADVAVKTVAAILTPWNVEQDRKREAEAKRLRDEAEALKAKAASSIQSDDIYDRIDGETMLKAIKDSEARANKIDRAPKGLRTHWEAEITDRRAALNALLKMHPDRFEALIEQLAGEAARGPRPPIPGVLYHERKTAI